MKTILFLLSALLVSTASIAQECDSLVNVCYDYLKTDTKNNKPFISDGQVYQAFVDVEQSAEFKVTLFGGTLYRIATTAGIADNFVIFNVRDEDGNILFSNEDFGNKPYWDFKVENTVNCYIEASLDMDKKISGCLVLLLGFQK